jgi:hypothetical protein
MPDFRLSPLKRRNMSIVRKNNLNIRKTVEKAINNHPEFHFFVDELTSDNYMPTYAGMADEKYTFMKWMMDFSNSLNAKSRKTAYI